MEEPEELLLELVQALHRRMIECVQAVAQQHDLSRMAMLVLRHIQVTPNETVSDVARRTGIAKSHISNTVELLSRKGFVDKRSDPLDRRLVRLVPTAKLQALGQAILIEEQRSLREILDRVPPETVSALLASLGTVLAAFERRAGKQSDDAPVQRPDGPASPDLVRR